MGMSADAYQAQLVSLLPRGRLWRALGDIWRSILLALGDSLARADDYIASLLREADPRTCSLRLPDWESATGLPDGCIPSGGTTQNRRDAVTARLASVGGANAAYFIVLAQQYGYTITITELATNTWRVNSAETEAVVNTTCNGTCNDPLETIGNEQLECLVTRLKPAHTVVTFAYGVS